MEEDETEGEQEADQRYPVPAVQDRLEGGVAHEWRAKRLRWGKNYRKFALLGGLGGYVCQQELAPEKGVPPRH